MKEPGQARASGAEAPTVLMVLANAYDPDERVRREALTLVRRGYRVKLLAWDRDLRHPTRENVEGVEVERVGLSSKHGRGTMQVFFYALLYPRMLWRGFRTHFDILHCHDLDTLPLGFLLSRLKWKPLIYDAHESFVDMLKGSVHPLVLRILEKFEDFLIRRVDLLITVGEKLRASFVARGARQTTVVGNWKRVLDYTRDPEANAAVRTKLGIPLDALVMVCITQLLRDRKLEQVIDAVDQTPGVYLILGGKGVLEGMVREAAARNPRFIYVGLVAGDDIPSYTCASDVVYYGFDPDNPNARFSAPNKLFEALAAGRPLITGDFGEIADVVRQASCGIILKQYTSRNVADAIAQLQNREMRLQMGRNAREFGCASANWERGEEILLREYARLLASPSMAAEAASVGGKP